MVGAATQRTLEPEDQVIVGFGKDESILLQRLLNQHLLKREVISLVGEGGMGKTTLAKRVFEELATTHFDICAWVVVSQNHNLKEMLIGILRCIMPITSEISMKDDSQLAEHLYRSLMGQKYLIVLDDIWTVTAWDAIQGCLPDNLNGSRILITTRFTEVARYTSEDPHFMKYLTLEASWALFVRKVFGRSGARFFFLTCEYQTFGRNDFLPFKFEDPNSTTWEIRNFLQFLGNRITLQCHGLPLAIVLIAGLLATVKDSLEIWRDVEKTLDGIDSIDDRISKILSLSYTYLPTHLKACFLYFGAFPEDGNILVNKIINLWVAEGFLKPQKNKSLEEVAENCLLDLINRSLVQVNELGIDGKIKSCKIHDRIHEICITEAKREKVVCVIDGKHGPKVSRWISCQSSHWPITRANYWNHTSKKIHSILYLGKELYLSKCRLSYPCLELLRVLDLSLVNCSHSMPSGIVELIHLRYLALSTIGSLYKFRLLKLQNLQTLIVCSWMDDYPLQLQCNILDLPQLRHLRLEKRCSQYLPSMVRENLHTLYWLKVTSSDQNPNFRMVPNLKELGIYVEGELFPGCLKSLVHLHVLEKLKFEIGRVERFYLPTAFPLNLKMLTLRRTYLPWKVMGIIGKLPNLEVLKLKDFGFCGPKWKPKKGQFLVLKVLLIAHTNLKQWNADVNHFPVLERLILRYCWDLKRVPDCFAKIGTMKLIMLDSCTSSLVASTNQFSSTNMLLFKKMPDSALRVRLVGTKVELPNSESSEEESVESSEEESVESSEEKSVESSDHEKGLKDRKSVMKYLKKVPKALKWYALSELKRKVWRALRRK
ncbi:PREDICTED: putative late blight resistance protein homolog R1B-17 [Ipomoea nil]|uniref:putative late blight resistance protein homolog R1B-17 n=1 Tax=Ipomoea nil TaxID=35883 RepID=UPI0009016C22|nr:PREDICTED: putative late blight resistance protein homolog R1B-17 [Ipomoea nil]XP_019177635.1 PREDICTED: putative late blight resistance protein homolog R1B-17 [Ipomoea nil]XP_019177636.1 PREDICTED: putative late blight resistance protein homolog R1B-17 [Ipomoea nil]XP_019177637.1 PREDICTED: putative late blight resistance protein homolog R1B-17 [Ipomoea nil]XP_019177638.1 PREDICTED: putative late blight resistance protein homolog R1B-17 [Ipomoea nil]